MVMKQIATAIGEWSIYWPNAAKLSRNRREKAQVVRLSEQEIRIFEKAAISRKYRKDELIYLEGDQSPRIYFVKMGRVRMYVMGEDGKEMTFQIVGEGQLFGESAFLSHASRPTTICAVVDSELLSCTIPDLLPILAESETLARMIFGLLADNYSFLCSQVKRLSLYDSRQRIASYLLEMTAPEKSGAGIEQSTLPYTHEELGVCLNLNRVTVTRILNELAEEHVVSLGRKKIRVLDRNALRKQLG